MKAFGKFALSAALAALSVLPASAQGLCGFNIAGQSDADMAYEPVSAFVGRHAFGFEAYQHISFRGDLSNSVSKMLRGEKVTVAFFGGSITEMRGWKNLVEDDLREQFPQADFEFVEAGIASLGTTPHAFRFETDVLGHGTPDLLFVEAAVNDHTNGFGPVEQVRGMEGIVRHALKANPAMDIVLLHFIYDPFIPMLEAGEIPDVVLNHERVANHYHLTSVDLTSEISDRMKAGQFDWEQFGGTHPAIFGHKFYAAAIRRVLQKAAEGVVDADAATSRLATLPEPLDTFCYENGSYVPLESASLKGGFALDPSWEPAVPSGLRDGFHGVQMASADKAGASLTLPFEGRAVGLEMVIGPDAGILTWRVDKGAWKTVDPYTQWSRGLYLPWTLMLETELSAGKHVLELRTVSAGMGRSPQEGESDDPYSAGVPRTACHIRNFVVNR